MKTIAIILTTLFAVTVTAPVYACSCDYSWQTAKDGSRCGDRAADRRPGGR